LFIATSHGEPIVFNSAAVVKLSGSMWHRVTGTPVSYCRQNSFGCMLQWLFLI
jgi:hypothetical protein